MRDARNITEMAMIDRIDLIKTARNMLIYCRHITPHVRKRLYRYGISVSDIYEGRVK